MYLKHPRWYIQIHNKFSLITSPFLKLMSEPLKSWLPSVINSQILRQMVRQGLYQNHLTTGSAGTNQSKWSPNESIKCTQLAQLYQRVLAECQLWDNEAWADLGNFRMSSLATPSQQKTCRHVHACARMHRHTHTCTLAREKSDLSEPD